MLKRAKCLRCGRLLTQQAPVTHKGIPFRNWYCVECASKRAKERAAQGYDNKPIIEVYE